MRSVLRDRAELELPAAGHCVASVGGEVQHQLFDLSRRAERPPGPGRRDSSTNSTALPTSERTRPATSASGRVRQHRTELLRSAATALEQPAQQIGGAPRRTFDLERVALEVGALGKPREQQVAVAEQRCQQIVAVVSGSRQEPAEAGEMPRLVEQRRVLLGLAAIAQQNGSQATRHLWSRQLRLVPIGE